MSIHVVKHVPDLGNKHNNGSHQYQIFDNFPVLCVALWAKNLIQLLGDWCTQ